MTRDSMSRYACYRPPLSRRAACGHCGDGLSDNFEFFKIKCFYISKRALEMTFESGGGIAARHRDMIIKDSSAQVRRRSRRGLAKSHIRLVSLMSVFPDWWQRRLCQ